MPRHDYPFRIFILLIKTIIITIIIKISLETERTYECSQCSGRYSIISPLVFLVRWTRLEKQMAHLQQQLASM